MSDSENILSILCGSSQETKASVAELFHDGLVIAMRQKQCDSQDELVCLFPRWAFEQLQKQSQYYACPGSDKMCTFAGVDCVIVDDNDFRFLRKPKR